MSITEPVTLLTDYALAAVSGWLAWRLFAMRSGQASRLSWALAFAALALAAAIGGTFHGFAPLLAKGVLAVLWKATVLAVGVASFGMLAGSATAAATGALRQALIVVAVVKLLVFTVWMLGHDDFIFVIADTSIALATVAVLHGWLALRRSDRASLWTLAGVAVSLFAAGVQASGFTVHQHFNHNDLYHVIQIAAMMLYYRGVSLMYDARP